MFIRAFPENRGHNPVRQANNNLASAQRHKAYQIKASRHPAVEHGHSGNLNHGSHHTCCNDVGHFPYPRHTPHCGVHMKQKENHDRCQDVQGKVSSCGCAVLRGYPADIHIKTDKQAKKGCKPDR